MNLDNVTDRYVAIVEKLNELYETEEKSENLQKIISYLKSAKDVLELLKSKTFF